MAFDAVTLGARIKTTRQRKGYSEQQGADCISGTLAHYQAIEAGSGGADLITLEEYQRLRLLFGFQPDPVWNTGLLS